MYCGKCGAEIAQDERFCGNCGAEINREDNPKIDNIQSSDALSQNNSKKRAMLIVMISIATVIVIGFGIFIYLFFTNQSKDQEFNIGIELGNKYVSELNYGDAISEFTKAIEIKPKEPKTYIKLAEVYTSQEDYDKALEILNNGLAQTQSEEIQAKITEVTTQKEEAEKVIELTSYYTYEGQAYYGGGIYNDDWIKVSDGSTSSLIVVDDAIYYFDTHNVNNAATSNSTLQYKSSLKKCNIDGSNIQTVVSDFNSYSSVTAFYSDNKICYMQNVDSNSYIVGSCMMFIYDMETGENRKISDDVPSFWELSEYGSVYSKNNSGDVLSYKEFSFKTNEITTHNYEFNGSLIGMNDKYIIYSKTANNDGLSIYIADKDGKNERMIIDTPLNQYNEVKFYNNKIFWNEEDSSICCFDLDKLATLDGSLDGLKTVIASDVAIAINTYNNNLITNYGINDNNVYYVNQDNNIMSIDITSSMTKKICKANDKIKSVFNGSYKNINFYIEDNTLFINLLIDGSLTCQYFARVPIDGGALDEYAKGFQF